LKSTSKTITEYIFPQLSLKVRAFNNLIRKKNSYLYTSGWLQSLKHRRPMNQKGEPIPWMNYPIINFLEERLNSDMTLFEYGSGYSTLFYASRVKSVVSVEYDMDWFNIMQSQLPSNVNLLYQTKDIDGEYCRKINFDGDRYDVVIVDGRDRVNCVKQSIQALTERGVILIDDSQRERYTEAIVFATEHGFKALSMEGLKPTGSKIDRTTILYKEGNCFGI
jgi:hypothetical protein